MNRNIRLLTIGVAVRMLGSAIYGPFIALYLHNVLNVGYIEIGLIILVIGGAQIPLSIAGGLVADRMRRKSLMIIGLATEAATTAVLAYAFSIESLFLAILAAFCGSSVSSVAGPAFSAYIADFAEGSERTRGFTYYRIGFNAGFAAGVAMGGLFIATIGFSGGVAVAAGVVAAATVGLFLFLGPSPRDVLPSGRPGPAFPVAPRVDPAPSRSFRESLGILRRDRPALEVAVAFALVTFVASQWQFIFPLYVHNVLGISYALLGIGLSLNGIVVVVGQSPTTESVIGWRHTSIAVLGIGLYGVAFVGLGAAGLLGLFPVVVFFVAVVVLTIGENLASIPQATLPSNLAPRQEVGSYNGAFNAFSTLGFILATLAGTVVLATVANPLLIWLVLIAPAVPAALLLRHASQRIPAAANRA